MLKKLFLIFLICMNIYTFIFVQIDKNLAINGQKRIPEVRLVALSSLGAAPGTLIGFQVFNHKTNRDNKGYLQDALYIVLLQNLLFYTAVFSHKSNKKKYHRGY